jgi:hypothetical protein
MVGRDVGKTIGNGVFFIWVWCVNSRPPFFKFL